MSPRTFFRYFESKEDVVLECSTAARALVAGLTDALPRGAVHLPRHVMVKLVSGLELRASISSRASDSTNHATVRAESTKDVAWADRLAVVIVQREKTRSLPRARALLLASVALAILQTVQEAWTRAARRAASPDTSRSLRSLRSEQ